MLNNQDINILSELVKEKLEQLIISRVENEDGEKSSLTMVGCGACFIFRNEGQQCRKQNFVS